MWVQLARELCTWSFMAVEFISMQAVLARKIIPDKSSLMCFINSPTLWISAACISEQRSRKLLLKQIRSIRQICQSIETPGFQKSVWTDRTAPQPETLIGLIGQCYFLKFRNGVSFQFKCWTAYSLITGVKGNHLFMCLMKIISACPTGVLSKRNQIFLIFWY